MRDKSKYSRKEKHMTTNINGIYECKNHHLCRDVDIPTHGLDIYCPTCNEPLDCVGEIDSETAIRIVGPLADRATDK